MGDQVYTLKDGENIPVEPVGDLAIDGLLTVEQETLSHIWTGYVVARADSDEEGNFIVVVAAVA